MIINGDEISKAERFKYFECLIQKNGGLEQAVKDMNCLFKKKSGVQLD